jgi:uncharacterized protein (DUF1786 family)
MRILTIDIGTGTQDIFLYDSRLDLENGFKLVVPSPTMIVHRRLREATHRGSAVLLTGVTMGGGPSQWAAEQHARAGLKIYATPDAARSFNDDLQVVEEMGIRVISQEEASNLPGDVGHLELRDFDFNAISIALSQFGVSLDELDAVAVGVFDHGDAPPGYSDRQFRFDYLARRIREDNRLSAFAFQSTAIPPIMTRLHAVARSARGAKNAIPEKTPLVVMDTAPAAILGAALDPNVKRRERKLIVNVGNFHTLAFRLGPSGIEGVFEHHTGLLDLPKLEGLLLALADGTLTHQSVFDDHGHGALVYHPEPFAIIPEGETGSSVSGLVVTGPRRSLMADSSLNPYFAVPYGDMMLTGCFGLLAATADVLPELSRHIHASLDGGGGSGTPPWELD